MKPGYIFISLAIVVALGVCSALFPEGVGAIVMLAICCAIAVPLLLRNTSEQTFILRLFFVGLLARIFFGSIIYIFGLSEFFGGDAITCDFRGAYIADYWRGLTVADSYELTRWTATSGAGWGMHYLVAAIYFIGGRNPLAAQALCWVVGACIGPVVFLCSYQIYKNSNVAKFAGMFIAVGWVLRKEAKENEQIVAKARRGQLFSTSPQTNAQ